MGISRRGLLKNGIRLAGGLALAACTPATNSAKGSPGSTSGTSAAPSGAAAGNVLKWGAQEEVLALEPFHSTGVSALQVYDTLYDGVTSRANKDYALQPRLAEKWQLLDPMTWQFKLRDNVKFHNGDPLTAEDVKFTMEYISDKKNKTLYPTTFKTVDRIEVVDKLTFKVITKEPDPFIADKLSIRPSYIIPMNHFLKAGFDKFNKDPVGSGPYKFKELIPGVSLTLQANPSYWRAKPTADEITLYPRPDLAARIAGLKAGELNFIDDLTFDQFDNVKGTAGLEAIAEKTTTIENWVINVNVPPLDKKPLRQALNISIDRKGLNDTLFKGTLPLCNGPVMPYEFSYDKNLPVIPYDPERAKKLLQDAEYKGETIIFEFDGKEQAVIAVQQGWKQVGINVDLRVIDPATAAQKRRQKSFLGIYTGGTASYYGDPNSSIWRQMAPGGTHRYWHNDEFDKLGAEQATSFDQKRRAQVWHRMVEIFNDEVPWLDLYGTVRLYGTGGNVDWHPVYSVTDEFHPERLTFK